MTDIAGVGVADDVACPFMACGICMASTNIFHLKRFELLKSAKFVRHVHDNWRSS